MNILPRRPAAGLVARIAALAALALAPVTAAAADTGRGLPFAVWLLLLPPAMALGVGLHATAARALKAFSLRLRPLAVSERAVAAYERKVYDSVQPPMQIVAALAVIGGLALWYAAYSASMLAWGLTAATLFATVVLDLLYWERVEVSNDFVWFRRGIGGSVHQVLIDNIRDVSVERTPVRGVTLRRGVRNVTVRLKMRLRDRYVVALPRTGGGDEIAAVARHIDERLAALRIERVTRPKDPERKLRRALRELRRAPPPPIAGPAAPAA